MCLYEGETVEGVVAFQYLEPLQHPVQDADIPSFEVLSPLGQGNHMAYLSIRYPFF